MSEPISQHIVPKCYLQNFAVEKRKDEFFVDVLFNQSEVQKIHRQNIKNICKIRDYYTFDDLPENEKRWLERYYSKHIESIYHDIYQTLINPEVDLITPELKTKILVYIIAQELRTPKLAEALNSIFNSTIEYAFLAHEQLGVQKKIYSADDSAVYDLEGKTIEEAIKESNNSNRQSANLESVRRLKRIAGLKMDYHILVTPYEGNLGLISSDRPVHADWPLYSPDCKFNLPIDRSHMVSLYPFDKEVDSNPLKILRLEHDISQSDFFVSIYNMHQVEKADRYLYGEKSDILKAINQYDELKMRNGNC
ncbi:DUF4238 domain-containing protein [Pedobacter aquatilis]|uniref:DUF4238 domain-containing protein n=1 Tax=Pedobacter aquatilis TaxID=351343 RepID=UPI0025B54E99|nr:DUF4238 domain-containing protein [Pedobacter aquatilis]MDN3587873.1 DUF4238 domain-containing protein [Pedobacter aquatilis]